MTSSLPQPSSVRRTFWKYRIAIGALLIVVGMVIAVSMNRHEARVRTEADRAQIQALENEIDARRKIRDQQFREQQQQLAKLEQLATDQARINDTQNDIIRALLRIRDNDPQLFEGVVLPTVQEFNDAVGSSSKNRSVKGQQGGGRPSGTKPKPKPDTPGPTPVKPPTSNGGGSSNNPSPKTPEPIVVPPTPRPPTQPTPIVTVPPVLPAPAQPGPIVDPITGLLCTSALVCLPRLGL
jgi:hypothetical protein